jgi:PAS domain S-box-containing protein
MAGKVYKSTKITRPAGKSKNQYSARSEFEQLADASRDAIRILNKDFTIRYVNRAYAEMTRVDQNDVVGKKCWELFYSPLCHTSDCRFQRIINGEETFQVEIERDGPEGVTIRCIVTVSPLFDRKHNLIGVIEHFHDISACRRMEEQVRESEDRYRAMIELGTEAGEAIVMLQDIDGMEGIQTFVNSRWLCITGYAREELIGKSFFDLVSPSNRADLIDSHRKRVSGNPMSGLFEMMIIDKNGAEIPIELTGACTHYQGKSADVLYIRDITKRKKNQAELKRYQTHLEELVVERTRALKVSEKRYQCLFQNIPVAIFEVDHSEAKKYIDKLRDQGITNIQKYFEIRIDAVKEFMRLVKVRDINKEAVDIYQAENKKEVFSFFNAKIADQKHFYESYKCIIDNTARGVSKYSYIEHIPTMKGEWHYNLLKFIPAAGCEGTLSRMLVSVFDITEQKNLEHNLKIYYEVEKSLREKLEQEIKQQLEFT